MDADFDLSRLDDIPDVIPADADRAPQAPASAPRTKAIEGGPSRAELRSRRWIAIAASFAWLTGHLALLSIRTDFAKLGVAYPALQIGLPALLSAIALGVAITPGREGLGAGVTALRAIVIGGVAGMTALVAAMPLPFAYVPPNVMTFGQWVVVCGDIVAMMAAVPLVLAAVVLRRSFVAASLERSAAVGAACGLAAVTAMHLHCENIQIAHVLAGHMIPAIAVTIVAALALRSITRA